ncbi:acetyl-CoA hydrolase/transferase family protein [Thiofilum flexile]|uniref:acetyl-CoA hydrolase/transferase family protein n=1 Tax=Thiofilum flexile TaxID=125627 RepID=UPI00047812CF|nr:acetyl-CoA hydrolase/transferase C-terminal domain-containing protein [Thiofilum flexile]
MTIICNTPLEAVSPIRSRQRVWCHSMAATPYVLLAALTEHVMTLEGVELLQLHLEHADVLAKPELEGHLRNRCYFASKHSRTLINQNKADYVPVFLSEIPKLFRRGEQPIDVALIQVSPPDRHGYCSLGVSVEATLAACRAAKTIIAQVNPQMPRTLGDAVIAWRDIDYAVEVESEIPQLKAKDTSPAHAQIGRYIAELIRDGDCLQMGIGAIPNAALAGLSNHQHLGIHSEMFSDGVIPLVEAGVIDNSRKVIHTGRIVTGFVLGSRDLYDFVDDNSNVQFLDIEYVNNPAVIRKNPQTVSINSAIEIDLTGQVCADSMGHNIYSGFGGQVDFVTGAQLSKKGRSIIALPSTAMRGQQSRIVPSLSQGAGVVTSRAQVDHIVTEFGVASLRGCSIRERAQKLIQIAHPDFREQLAQAAGV